MTRPFAKIGSDNNVFVFKDQLLREMLHTERLRAAILVGLIPTATVIIMIISRIDQSDFTYLLRESGTEKNILVMTLIFWTYELLIWGVAIHTIHMLK